MTCDDLRGHLAEAGEDAIAGHPSARQHLAGCPACTDFVAALRQLDLGLAAMPAIDASDELVEQTLARVRSEARADARKASTAPAPPASRFRRLMAIAGYGSRRFAPALVALAAILVLCIVAVPRYMRERPRDVAGLASGGGYARLNSPSTPPTGRTGYRQQPATMHDLRSVGKPVDSFQVDNGVVPAATPPPPATRLPQPVTAAPPLVTTWAESTSEPVDKEASLQAADGPDAPGVAGSVEGGVEGGIAGGAGDGVEHGEIASQIAAKREAASDYLDFKEAGNKKQTIDPSGQELDRLKTLDADTRGERQDQEKNEEIRDRAAGDDAVGDVSSTLFVELGKVGGKDAERRESKLIQELPTPPSASIVAGLAAKAREQPASPSVSTFSSLADAAAGDVRRFLAERDATRGLRFQKASGYWANTYLPGDPQMRGIALSLQQTDPGRLALAESARRYVQPFDAPTSAALALYLHADKAEIQGPTRLLVQVGIKGALRQAAARSPMNVGVVLDLAQAPTPASAARMRALLDALARAKSAGDRFFLIVAGRPGGLVVAPDDFKSGPLTVTLARLLAGTSAGPGTPTLSLAEALALAGATAAAGDDPDAPLGGSAVLVVSERALGGSELSLLCRNAHRAAIAGVPTSVITVGDGTAPAGNDRLTLAGQGNRRFLTDAREAKKLVDAELHAQSRVVARALRLRLRLAPKVQLVGVLDSYRLDRDAARRVKQAEKSVDQRLARSLGIDADRGKDEDGIQIVIPAFQSGDDHVILLDVVVPGPGPVLDASVRYKDVLYLRNGVARSGLTLPAGTAQAGPLERNVLKNFIARSVARDLAAAADQLAAGQTDAAALELRTSATLLSGLRAALPGMAGDPELLADERLLAAAAGAAPGAPATLAQALRYSSFLKTHTPLADGGLR